MIYGDNPQNINQREDALGLTTYTHVPQISAVMQSGNLYVYCISNPVSYNDENGRFLGWAVGAVVGGICGAIGTAITNSLLDKPITLKDILAGAASGAVSGLITGAMADFVAATGGAGAFAVAAYAAAGVFGSAAGVGVKYAITGEGSMGEALSAALLGGAFGALGGLMQDPAKSLASIAAQKGRTVAQQAYRELAKEVKNLPMLIATGFVSTGASWSHELFYRGLQIRLRDLFS